MLGSRSTLFSSFLPYRLDTPLLLTEGGEKPQASMLPSLFHDLHLLWGKYGRSAINLLCGVTDFYGKGSELQDAEGMQSCYPRAGLKA